MIDKLSANVPKPKEGTYIGHDGLLYCEKCGEPLEAVIDVPFIGEKKVRCICSCMEAERMTRADRQRREENERRKRICFKGQKLADCTFANSEENENLKIGINYVDNWKPFKKEGKGILLYGSVGTGKSHLAACIANALIEEGERVVMRNFATIANTLFNTEDKQEYIDSLCGVGLLIIDDLGAERDSKWMHENVFNVIDTRINTGLPLIVTTNLTNEQLGKPQGDWEKRIYDRVLGVCHPIEIKGKSMRRKRLNDEFREMQQLLLKEI